MSHRARLLDWFAKPPDSAELTLAQWAAASRQVPLLYCMLVANSLILAWTHRDVAPATVSLYIPLALTLVCAFRTLMWWRHRNLAVSVEKARRGLRAMIGIGGLMSLGFAFWSFSLYPYGDAYLQSQIAFYMGITTIGCMFCLMHVRTAALVVGLCSLVPFTIFFSVSGQVTFIAICINMALVIAALLVILLTNSRDFAALVASRTDMARRQFETQAILEENHRLANIDSLTGLPNRRSFDRQLAAALHESAQSGEAIAVALLDLDRFKSINEIFGLLTGDRVLVEVARRLDALRRPDMFIARLDSNTFALLMHGSADANALMRWGDILCRAMRQPFDLPGAVIRLTVSIGFTQSRPGDRADHVFDRADYATSVAKRENRGGCVVYGEHHDREISKIRRMEHLLETADLEREIYILLQPQFDVSTGMTTGFEALARWRSPILGEVSPGEFIPMAERTGQICRITQMVLKKALDVSVDLPRPLRLSVNLSAHDIGSTAVIEQIVAQVSQFGTPCRIDFEITETAVMHDLRQANLSLLALLNLGARIALDDFGTGHSSLTHVQKLPLHRIKIDRSFVSEVTDDAASRAIIKTMIDLSRNLGISCVLEGIETEEQLDALVLLGGHIMQGYLFGRPMPVDALPEYLAREKSLRNMETRAISA